MDFYQVLFKGIGSPKMFRIKAERTTNDFIFDAYGKRHKKETKEHKTFDDYKAAKNFMVSEIERDIQQILQELADMKKYRKIVFDRKPEAIRILEPATEFIL